MTVYFIGAGPGDPELLTLKAQRLMRACPIVLYAGSLIPREVLADIEDSAEFIADSASMNLDEIMTIIKSAHDEGKDVARLHSGDPMLYGAIGEQIRHLEHWNIDYEIIPGVTAVSASAAWLGKELTLSGISQTIILTRFSIKTPFPEQERLSVLAKSQATLAIHLGVTHIHKIVEELVPHYGEHCPVAVCYRTSWPEQDRVTGTLKDITAKVREKKFTRTCLILVGHVLQTQEFDDSFLYDDEQVHVYRPRDGKVAKAIVRGKVDETPRADNDELE